MGYKLYEVFKDDFDPKRPWRVQMPKGRMDFRLKREAVEFAEKMKVSVANRKPGRPKGSVAETRKVSVSYRLSVDVVEWIRNQGNQAQTIERLVREAMRGAK